MKEKLLSFIKKYHLNGEIELVRWDIKKTSLLAAFVTSNKSLLGFGIAKGIELEPAKIGIYSTSDMIKILEFLDDDMKFLRYEKNEQDMISSIIFKDKHKQAKLALAATDAVPNVQPVEEPKYQMVVKITEDFISDFINAKNALSNADTFTIIPSNKGKSELILGFQAQNTNTITLKIDAEMSTDMSEMTFSSKVFKEVLSVNKGCGESILQVSNEGIAKIRFETKENDFIYYLAANDMV